VVSGNIWLAAIVIAPVVAIFLLNANAALVFLSLCLGYVLYSFDSHNAASAIHSLHQYSYTAHLKPSSIAINLFLLLGPAVITLITQIRTVHGSRRLINLIPALFCGLFAALIVVPVLPASIATSIGNTSDWAKLTHYEGEIVGIGAAVAIVFFWMSARYGGGRKNAHKIKG
jgi:hypothetical protein